MEALVQYLMLPPGGSATRAIMPGMGGSGTVGMGGAVGARIQWVDLLKRQCLHGLKLKLLEVLDLNTPGGRMLWLASLGIPWVANQTRKAADKIGETETISVNVSGIPRAIDIPVDSPVKQNVEAQAVGDLEKAFPGMSNNEIIEQANTQSGIEIAPNQVDKVVNQVNENQIDNPDQPPQLDTTLVAEDEDDEYSYCQ